jgi:DNA-binding MarR family transcriptional regulator
VRDRVELQPDQIGGRRRVEPQHPVGDVPRATSGVDLQPDEQVGERVVGAMTHLRDRGAGNLELGGQRLGREGLQIRSLSQVPTRVDVAAVPRTNIGFLLAKASQRWNECLADAFRTSGHGDVRPSYGSVLVPLFEEDGLRMGELAARSHLAKQTMTTMVRAVEQAGYVERRSDSEDARATRVHLTAQGIRLRPVAAREVARLEARVGACLGFRRTAALRATLAQVIDL